MIPWIFVTFLEAQKKQKIYNYQHGLYCKLVTHLVFCNINRTSNWFGSSEHKFLFMVLWKYLVKVSTNHSLTNTIWKVMTLKSCESPSKRHSWTWSGCGHTAGIGVLETVGGELLEGTESPQKSNTIEVLRKDGEKGGHEMIMIMGRTQLDRYSPEPSKLSNGNVRYDLNGPKLTKETRLIEELTTPDSLMDVLDLVTEETECLTHMNGHLLKNVKEVSKDNQKVKRLKKRRVTEKVLSKLELGREIGRILLCLGLLLGEGMAWFSLYIDMEAKEHNSILIFLLLPTLVTSLAWFSINWYNKEITMKYFCLVAFLLVCSLPSPLLV